MRAFPNRLAALVYLLLAVPVVLFMVVMVPPFQGPDENNHFLRAVQLSRGGLVGERQSDVSAGGMVDADAAWLVRVFFELQFHPERKLDPAMTARARTAMWSERPVYARFGNTVRYPPVLYVPAVAGIVVARGLGLPMLDGLYAARLGSALAGLGCAALAVLLAARAVAVLFVLLSLPMTLCLFATCSQDGLIIGLAALAAALLSGRRGAVVAAVMLGAVVAARLPYLPLAAVPAVVFGGRRRIGFVLLLVAIPLAMAGVWTVFGAGPVTVELVPGSGVSAADQLAGLLHAPGRVPGILWESFRVYYYAYYVSFVGLLGWLDTYLAPGYYRFAWVAILGVAVAEAVGKPRGGGRWLLGLVVIGGFAALFLGMYLSWTAVGADRIEGIQGRYFIPLLAVATLVYPAGRAGWPAWAVAGGFAAITWWCVPAAVLARYYG